MSCTIVLLWWRFEFPIVLFLIMQSKLEYDICHHVMFLQRHFCRRSNSTVLFYVNLPILFALFVYASYCIKVRSKQCDATILGPIFTKMSDILSQDLAKSRSHEMHVECLKSLWNLTGTSTKMPVKFRSDTFIIRYNLAALRRQDIWRYDVFYLVNINLKGNGLP